MPRPADNPPRDKLADTEDELDGCSLDFTEDAIGDDEILRVVFGDDPKKWAAYRELFGPTTDEVPHRHGDEPLHTHFGGAKPHGHDGS